MPKRTCANGHSFTKTSDCPTCPKCEAAKKPADGFLAAFVAPARRALERAGIDSVKKLLAEAGLTFKASRRSPSA